MSRPGPQLEHLRPIDFIDRDTRFDRVLFPCGASLVSGSAVEVNYAEQSLGHEELLHSHEARVSGPVPGDVE